VKRRHYDEMHGADGDVRAHFRALADWLAETPAERVAEKRREADLLFHRVGITFAVYGDDQGTERLIPFDIIPRILPAAEWRALEAGLRQRVKALNRLYVAQPALHQVDFGWEGFQWIDIHDVDNSIVSFIRRARDPGDFVVLVANFTPVPREGYRVGVPAPGFYRELLNSDSTHFGGGNMGNSGGLPAEPTPWQGQAHSISMTVPPLAVVFFKPDNEEIPSQGS